MLPCELPAWFLPWPLCTLTSSALRTAEPQQWPCHTSRLLAGWGACGSRRGHRGTWVPCTGSWEWMPLRAPSPACPPPTPHGPGPLTSRSSSRHGSWRSAGGRRPAQESVRPVRCISCSFRWEAAEPPLNAFPCEARSLTFGDVGVPLLREPTCPARAFPCSHRSLTGCSGCRGRVRLAWLSGKESRVDTLLPGSPCGPAARDQLADNRLH